MYHEKRVRKQGSGVKKFIEENPFISDLFERWNNERYENGEIGKNSYTKYGNDFKRFFQKDDSLCEVPMKEITCHPANYLEPFSSVYSDEISGPDNVTVNAKDRYSAMNGFVKRSV